jgi:hypothetical protein
LQTFQSINSFKKLSNGNFVIAAHDPILRFKQRQRLLGKFFDLFAPLGIVRDHELQPYVHDADFHELLEPISDLFNATL